MSKRTATIIYNPMSGRPGRRSKEVSRMIDLLSQRGIEANASVTEAADDARRLARKAIDQNRQIIISYGGDGTLNEIVQEAACTDVLLAVWPGGTSNVVARDLGVPFDPPSIAEMIAAGKTRRIALGLATRADASEDSHDCSKRRYFVMMAGIGLDASIARGVNRKLKRRTGEFAYWLSGLRHFFTWEGEPFTIDVDGRGYESTFALIGNGKGYGGGMVMTPNADLEEPLFEVYILPPQRGKFAYLRALRACLKGSPQVPGVSLIKAKHVEANSAAAPWVEADGEIIGPLPVKFDIVPDALSIIVPG